jgi:hypothetical protein
MSDREVGSASGYQESAVPEDSFRRGYDARRRLLTGRTAVAAHVDIDQQETKVLCRVLHPGALENGPKKKPVKEARLVLIDRC